MKAGFSRFLAAAPGRLHAAAHSHHPWPDVTFAAHQQAWEDAARYADDKWDHVFGVLVPETKAQVASILGLPSAGTLVFAPNTHEFVLRIASTLPRPFSVLTSDAEFHSFARQLARWEEAGVATAARVPAEPFETFPERLTREWSGHDLIFFSHVHFNSGYVVPDLVDLVASFPAGPALVIDGYHGFMAVPTDLAAVASRAFYLAGGYKYAMAGEGACFLHVPDAAADRPINTGWWAGFGALADTPAPVAYTEGGERFGGATADPSGIYRLHAVLDWLDKNDIGPEEIHKHVGDLQGRLLAGLDSNLRADLLPGSDAPDRGHFLTFRRSDAGDLYRRLHTTGVITDYRSDRWRIGLGIYHDTDDVDLLASLINAALDNCRTAMDLYDFWIRMLAGAGFAAILGLEREATGKPAGLRTHAMVGLGSSLFTVISIEGFPGADTSRVAAQIVSGIGFLGAGAIFRSGPLVKGLTTAAGLWAAAALGLAAGTGKIGLAAIATAIAVVVLLALRAVDRFIGDRRIGTTIEAVVRPGSAFLDVQDQLHRLDPQAELSEINPEEGATRLRFTVGHDQAELLASGLAAMAEVAEARVVE